MRNLLFVVVFAAGLLGATGPMASPGGTTQAPATGIAVPSTVEGFLIIEASDGEVDAAGIYQNNFGTLTVGKQEIAIEVSGNVLGPVALPPEGGRVRAKLGSMSSEFGFELYLVSELQRL